ncbi:MAG: cache domain-containing protein, partial [Planctomycetes bacterium]|nr:cache domain-containing protein [Planctomycetota bacterium]
MKHHQHADSTEKSHGIRGENIHLWIDAYFDGDKFKEYSTHGPVGDYNPYNHRKYRHCIEALEDAYREFEDRYTRDEIKKVFETHLKDDYQGYTPSRADFDSEDFLKKFHHAHEAEELVSLPLPGHREHLSSALPQSHPTRKKVKRAYFSMRITIPAILAILLFVVSIYTLIIPILERSYLERKKEMIEELVNSSLSLLNSLNDKVEDGTLSLEKAQAQAKELFYHMRYGKDNQDYFWITDHQPTMIVHPFRKDLIGSDLNLYHETESLSGENLFLEFVEVVKKQGSGYVQYEWRDKHDTSRIVPKLSFVKEFTEWGWILGTGVYIDDIHEEINHFRRRLAYITLIITLLMIILLTYINIRSVQSEHRRIDAERDLSESREKYRALVEASTDGFLMLQNNKVVYANIVVNDLLKGDEANFDARTLLPAQIELNYVSDGKDSVGLHTLLEHLVGKSSEMFLGSLSGEWLPVQVSATRIFMPDSMAHVVSFKDLRSHQSMEESLVEQSSNQHLSHSNEMLTELQSALLFLNQPLDTFKIESLSCSMKDNIQKTATLMTRSSSSSIIV